MPTQAILPLTKQLAYAAAHDAGNRHMRAAGRTVWAVNDYNVACATFDAAVVTRPRHVAYAPGKLDLASVRCRHAVVGSPATLRWAAQPVNPRVNVGMLTASNARYVRHLRNGNRPDRHGHRPRVRASAAGPDQRRS
jgi:hypothetical protein